MAKARQIPGLQADLPLRLAAARAVEVRATELLEHSTEVLDTEDIEAVHDMRVASRRLRAVLEIFAPCFPPDAHRSVLREVKALADALGERRDPDVAIAALEAFADAAPRSDRPGVEHLIERFGADQRRGNEALAIALRRVSDDDLAGRLEGLVLAARTASSGAAPDAPGAYAGAPERHAAATASPWAPSPPDHAS